MKFLSLILILSLFSSYSFGLTVTTNDGSVCDFSTIKANADGTYTYSATQNSCVGKIIQDSKTKDVQISDLYKSVDQYKLTIQTDEQRIQNLMITLTQVSARIEKAEDLQKSNDKLAFGLGVLTTLVAAEAMSKLAGH
jgi:hypothetical protein